MMSSMFKPNLAFTGAFVLSCSCLVSSSLAVEKAGPDLQSAGALAFGPDGTLLIGDQDSAAIFAVPTGEKKGTIESVEVEDLKGKIASALGTTSDDIRLRDLAVHPGSGSVYVSVSRGHGADAMPVIVRVTSDGSISEFELDEAEFTKAELPNAPDASDLDRRGNSRRMQSITDLAYFNGQVFVAGLSNEEFASTLHTLDYPFGDKNYGASVEIYHGAHGAYETRSPVRTFMPFDVGGEPHLVAAYTCTPLVIFPIEQLKTESLVKGRTVAELGNRNRPLDMIVYEKEDEAFLLMANSSRGVMKITTRGIEDVDAITSRVGGGGTAGLAYDTISDLRGVVHLDKLDDRRAVVLATGIGNKMNLRTIDLP